MPRIRAVALVRELSLVRQDLRLYGIVSEHQRRRPWGLWEMGRCTPSLVKNLIRRSLREIVDPIPTEKGKTAIWAYFNNECAFCGKRLGRTRQEGHIDHLVPSSRGGTNHLSNRVLSCATCNEKEKLDTDWKKFLHTKVSDPNVLMGRMAAIEDWRSTHGTESVQLSQELCLAIESAAQRAINVYDECVDEIRLYRDRSDVD